MVMPESLRRVLEKKNATPRGTVTTTWRDGTVIREHPNGRLEQLSSVQPIPEQDDDNPFPP